MDLSRSSGFEIGMDNAIRLTIGIAGPLMFLAILMKRAAVDRPENALRFMCPKFFDGLFP